MKNLTTSVLLWGLLSTLIFSCSDENTPVPEPKPTEEQIKEQVKEIVKELEKKPELAKFTEELKKIDVANVEEEELTVFAVKNEAWNKAQTRTESTTDIKRHIAKGSYAPEELKDSMLLTSISNDQLFVTRSGNEVSINGVGIETNGTKVGKSYIYTVPEVIPVRQDTIKTKEYSTTITVLRCNTNWSPENNVEGRPVSKAIVQIYEVNDIPEKEPWKTIETDGNGQVTFTHTQQLLEFKAYAGDSLTNVYNGFMVQGIFTSQAEIDANFISYPTNLKPGDYKLRDLNGDGMINDNDKVNSAVAYEIFYDTISATKKEYKIFLTKDVEKPNIDWNTALSETKREYQALFDNYVSKLLATDEALLQKSSYPNHITNLSDSLWNASYKVIRCMLKGEETFRMDGCPTDIQNQWNAACEDMQADAALIYSTLVNFYGGAYALQSSDDLIQVVDKDNVLQKLDLMIEYLPKSKANAVHCAIARVCLNGNNYEKAASACEYISAEGDYKLLTKESAVFDSKSNKEVIWGGYQSTSFKKGSYYHSSKYSEVLLMLAQAYLEMGDTMKSTEAMNQFRMRDGKENIPTDTTPDELRQILNGLWKENMDNEGLSYAYLRNSGTFVSTLGVDEHFQLLPIPMEVINANHNIQQNPGYTSR